MFWRGLRRLGVLLLVLLQLEGTSLNVRREQLGVRSMSMSRASAVSAKCVLSAQSQWYRLLTCHSSGPPFLRSGVPLTLDNPKEQRRSYFLLQKIDFCENKQMPTDEVQLNVITLSYYCCILLF